MAAFFASLKQNFIAYRSSKVSSRYVEIHQLWQSGFSRVYSNCCNSCLFKAEIIKIGHSSQKIFSHNILNFQASMTILNACTKRSGNLLKKPRIYKHRRILLFQIRTGLLFPDFGPWRNEERDTILISLC